MLHPKISLTDLYQEIEPDDVLSISPSPMGGRIAVSITGTTRTLWVVPYNVTPPGVFLERADMALRYLGDLDIEPVSEVDKLYELVTTCPRCRGSGEVDVINRLESGHVLRGTAPCPLCQFPRDELPF